MAARAGDAPGVRRTKTARCSTFATLLAWGTDLIREGGRWSTARARGYRSGAKVRDPYQLRVNAYRVLLTRGRDATMVFVPRLDLLDETYAYLTSSGFVEVTAA